MTAGENNKEVIASAEQQEQEAERRSIRENLELLGFVGLPALVALSASIYFDVESKFGVAAVAAACGLAYLVLWPRRIE